MHDLAYLQERFDYYGRLARGEAIHSINENMPKTEVPKVTKLPKCDQKVTFGTNGTQHMVALHENNTNNVITLLTLSKLNDYEILHADKIYINRFLMYKSDAKKQRIIDQYCKVYIKAYRSELVVYKQSNSGRYAANIWLRDKRNVSILDQC